MTTTFQRYRPTVIEESLVKFYKENGVRKPSDIRLDLFLSMAEVVLHELPRPSSNFRIHQRYTVVVDSRLPWRQRRVEFVHELAHILMHSGRQDLMPIEYRSRQEWQADQFTMYALAPTFMLEELISDEQFDCRYELVGRLAEVFDVPEIFMDARMDILAQRLVSVVSESDYPTLACDPTADYDYTIRHPIDKKAEFMVRDGRIVGRLRNSEYEWSS